MMKIICFWGFSIKKKIKFADNDPPLNNFARESDFRDNGAIN